jgi:phage baseplate assembly protein gpV
MSDRLLAIIQQVVQQELAHQRTSLLGVVSTIFPHEAADDDNNYEVNVRLKHEELELRRVPLAVPHIGVAAPPRVGDLVLVHFINGDLNQPVISGRFYHADERPPLHKADDVLFEQRLADGKLNQLRFTADGTIFIQRQVTRPEDNSAARAGIKLDPDGNIEIKAGDKIVITLTNDNNIAIKADGQPITVDCDTLSVTGNVEIDGTLKVSQDTTVDTQVIVGTGPQTTIMGGAIQGG